MLQLYTALIVSIPAGIRLASWWNDSKITPPTSPVPHLGSAPPGDMVLSLEEGALDAGEEKTWSVDVWPGTPVLLSLEARIGWHKLAGSAAIMELEVNGVPVADEMLINKPDTFTYADGREFAYYGKEPGAHSCWTLFYSPDFESSNKPGSGYQVLDGQAYVYVFDITQLVQPERANTITLANRGEPVRDKLRQAVPLVFRRVRLLREAILCSAAVEYTADALPGNSAPAWSSQLSPTAHVDTSSGFLYLDTTNDIQEQAFFAQNWNASSAQGAAVEARVRLDDFTGDPKVGGAAIWIEDDVNAETLIIHPQGIQLYASKLSYNMDTMDGYHLYRIVTLGNDIKVYVDGKLAIDGAGALGHARGSHNRVAFGDGSSGASSRSSWDYVRYTLGGECTSRSLPSSLKWNDSEWKISFVNALGWDYESSSASLAVKDISPLGINHDSGGTWAVVKLRRDVTPRSDFDVNLELGWDSEGSVSAMQYVAIWLLDPQGNRIAGGGYHDAWVSYSGAHLFYVGQDKKSFERGADPLAGESIISIHRNKGYVQILRDGAPVHAGKNSEPVTAVEIEFGYYPFRQNESESFFGAETIRYLELE